MFYARTSLIKLIDILLLPAFTTDCCIMAGLSWSRLAIISLVGFAIAVPPFKRTIGNASIPVGLAPRQDDELDPGDLSFLTKLAAIGDSYSAGISAGDRLGSINGKSIEPRICNEKLNPHKDWKCSRYDHSYPNLLNQDSRLGDSSKRNFQFESCSGAVIDHVIEKQLPNLDSNQQVILLSAGMSQISRE